SIYIDVLGEMLAKKMAEQAAEGIISFKWNNHKTTFFNVLASLRAKEVCTDATLGCDGKLYPVHKLVLCSSSDYFCDIFKETRCKSPVVILKDVHHNNLEALLDYMYLGEVEIQQKDLPDLIEAAECLRIKGLAVPDDLVLTPSKELSPIKKEVFSKTFTSSSYYSPSDINAKLSLPGSNFSDSEYSLQSNNTRIESEICEPPLKRPKKEKDKSLKLNDSKNFSSRISEDFCKALNAVEVPLRNHSDQHQTSLNPFPDSCTIQKKTSENETYHSNTSMKKVQLKRKRNLKRSLSVKESIIKNCNSSKAGEAFCSDIPELQISKHNVISIKVEHASLDKAEKTLNSENEEENSLRSINNVDRNHFEEPENKSLRARNRKSRGGLEERNRLCEEFCDEIGVPNFSESLTPYIAGHDLEIKEKRHLSNKLIEELAEHLYLHNMLERMENSGLRSNFYRMLQQRIINKYPNIIQEESKRKSGKKGPLSSIINRVSAKICNLARKYKEAEKTNEATSSNSLTENNLNPENVDEDEGKEDIDAIVTEHSFESNSENIKMEYDSNDPDENPAFHIADS
ncbi:Transcription factor GAGA, partial [Armadillidium nasatum]